MKTHFITLLALLSAALINAQTSSDYTCAVRGMYDATTKDSTYYTNAHMFVPDGPYMSASGFWFVKGQKGVMLNIMATSASPKTYIANSEFLFTFDDGSSLLLSIGPDDVKPEYNETRKEYDSMIKIYLSDENVQKILKSGIKKICLGTTTYSGGFFMLEVAKKKFIADLTCIAAKKAK